MDIFTNRRERLKKLIEDDFGGNQAAFSKHTNIKAPQVNRWLSTTADDTRNITESSARAIELKCEKPPRWLDQPSGEEISYATNTKNQHLVARSDSAWQPAVAVDNSKNNDEHDLISGFRVADEVTQGHMLDMARKALSLFSRRSETN